MQQLTFSGANELRWRQVAEPTLDSDAAALVRPIAVATCDLDALIIAGESPFPPPFPIGHECVAEVIDAGGHVSSFERGTLVSVPFQISCGECAPCRRGRTGNCASVGFMSTYGFGPAVERWGGFFADVVCVPYAEHMLVPLPAGLAPGAVASASDNISDAWRAVAPALEQEPGAPVLVVGGAGSGSIGLYAAAIAVALGSEAVTYVDAGAASRATAESLGAVTVAEMPARLGPFPITVDASADPDGLGLALRSTAPDGTCTSTAIYFGKQPSLPLLEMYTKCVTFKIGRVHARPAIARVLEPERVTTRTIAWSDAADALLERDWCKLVFER